MLQRPKLRKIMFLKFHEFNGHYLNSPVDKFIVFSEILQANKSIRIAQLTFESLLVSIGSKVVRQAAILINTLQSTRTLRIHFYLSNDTSVESSSSYLFSKVGGFEVWLYRSCYSICKSLHYTSQQPLQIHVLILKFALMEKDSSYHQEFAGVYS